MDIIELLKKTGHAFFVNKKMMLDAGFSDEAARQKISRAGIQVKTLQGNLLPRRTSFYT